LPQSKVKHLLYVGTIFFALMIPETYSHAQSTPAPVPGPTKLKTQVLPATPAAPVAAVGGPTITKVDPDKFLLAGGSIVTIKGANFTTASAAVTFGAITVLPPNVVVQDSATIKAVVPMASKVGTVAVTVTNNVGMSAPVSMTYVDPKHCWFIPTMRGMCQGDATVREANINSFYGGIGQLTFFNQIKSIYNGASSSTTIAADLTTLNFSNGMQMTVGTNIQAGSSGTTTDVALGTIPTLSASGAGQAAQNMIFGGNVTVRAVLPVVGAGIQTDSPGGIGGTMNFVLQEGVDLQNFKAGASTTADSPPSHSAAQMEGYLMYNSINLAPGTDSKLNIYAGQIFIGGSYGYSYSSHDYARDYGFGSVNNGVGQASAGVLINKVAKIAVSRGFGPSQTYIDSTSMTRKTVNNFKSWSFGITYQSPPTPTPTH
jgi:IPT/TIG domain